ncbi:gamma-glutamyl hydrolase-like [Pecten maximus]|uniref:gamma-glutamyl hydrolase-like n=1 Tax=Pecten maximus TaxID=6579 RepID=UPI001459039C|nr:gamma-glutamyl hydrolase-like [Pecten maximus]XP_033748721.1 gamma-glutamyl hydrolase-like [Pecten maximus]
MYSAMVTIVISFVIQLRPTICDENLNSRPIIGVLAQSCDPKADPYIGDTYIPSTYVKWLESGGARVVPIRVKESDQYYETLFKRINGVVFPGGGINIVTSYFAKAAKLLYNMALKANDDGDYFPLWGTCQGFQQLTVLTSGQDLLSYLHAHRMLPINLTSDFSQSRLFADLPADILTSLTLYNVTANHHNWGLSPKNFSQNQALRSFYRVLSTNVADNGKDFISTFEAIKYPFYGVQWHPEKVPYDWDLGDALTHTKRGVKVTQYFADFFVEECRKSSHHFPDIDTELSTLINNYHPHFSKDKRFQEHYYFNFTHPHLIL